MAAGEINTRNRHFLGTHLSLDEDLRAKLQRIVARSRQLARGDEGYIRRFLQLCEDCIVGSEGILLHSKAKNERGEDDKSDQKVLESAWKDWCKPVNADLRQKRSYRELQAQFVRTLLVDGEYLARIWRGAPNGHRFAIQPLDPQTLDLTLNGTVPRKVGERESDSNKIVMGVEQDQYTRPVAYWILQKKPSQFTEFQHGRYYLRLPAEDVIHEFRMVEGADHNRGIPAATPAVLRLEMLAGFEEAELTASRANAAKMGYYKSESGAEYSGDDEGANGELIETFEPASMIRLPAGMEMGLLDPTHPNANTAAMVKVMLRGIAVGLGIDYNSLAGDLEGVNYSSLRSAALQQQDRWRTIQNFVRDVFCERVFGAWLEQAFLTGKISAPIRKYDKFRDVTWTPRGFPWVDPLKEANANKIAILETFTKTPSQVVEEQGGNWEDHVARLKSDREDLEEAGMPMQFSQPQTVPPIEPKEDED